ncbi:uncharacterized protein LOC8285723 [Ricinus communis]|uniref:DUF4228 domain protein n=1 Tax=Ricinus communis TaxID=3988 RepID=B9RG31_RICCO|nr:uncharacterized protein LOC8285723 [Ricinus communis]EEF50152.1 conserved hypothetical protein [Ricinus communis]|eukprot:XP_025011885.1 uncharacterized protein LOC8285723 isoform X2 [Ricinus communis]
MGRKFMNLQMIPWCLQLMGNHISCVHIRPEPPAGTVKLIKSDGLVKIYDRPIHVSELLHEYPKHLVCRSDSFYIGQKIPALSENDQLQLGHKYFLLPKHCFQSVLSFVTIASFVTTSQPQLPHSSTSTPRDSTNALLKKAATCRAFDIQKSPSGCLRIRVSDEFISQLLEEGKMEEDDRKITSRVCTTPQLQKDYGLLVRSRQWKPKLETIREKEKRKLSNSFGMKRRKKSLSSSKGTTQKANKSSEYRLHPTSTSKPSSKSKSKIKMKMKLRK